MARDEYSEMKRNGTYDNWKRYMREYQKKHYLTIVFKINKEDESNQDIVDYFTPLVKSKQASKVIRDLLIEAIREKKKSK